MKRLLMFAAGLTCALLAYLIAGYVKEYLKGQ